MDSSDPGVVALSTAVNNNLRQDGGVQSKDSGIGKTRSTSNSQSSMTSTDSTESDTELDVTPTSVHQHSTPGVNLTESGLPATNMWEYSYSECIPGCDKLLPKLEEGEWVLPSTSLTLELKDYYRSVVSGRSPSVLQKEFPFGEFYIGPYCTHTYACMYGMHAHRLVYTHIHTYTHACTHTCTLTHTHARNIHSI